MHNIQELLPQHPPVLMITEITRFTKEETVSVVDWVQASFFHNEKRELMVCALPEMIAQTVAVMQGLKDKEEGRETRLGLLTALKKFKFHQQPQSPAFLTVKVFPQRELGAHKIVKGFIFQEDVLLAEGEVFLFIVE